MTETQFNLFEGERQKEQGMERANGAELVQDWKAKASEFFEKVMFLNELFTSDWITHNVGMPDEGPNKCNVVGAWISGLSKSGRIVFQGSFHRSYRVTRHSGLQRVWKKVK